MDREQFGKFIFEERNRQGLSQKELADKACISRKRVSEIEKNRYNYGIDTLVSCLLALNFELNAASLEDDEKSSDW